MSLATGPGPVGDWRCTETSVAVPHVTVRSQAVESICADSISRRASSAVIDVTRACSRAHSGGGTGVERDEEVDASLVCPGGGGGALKGPLSLATVFVHVAKSTDVVRDQLPSPGWLIPHE